MFTGNKGRSGNCVLESSLPLPTQVVKNTAVENTNAEIIHPKNRNISEKLSCNLNQMLNDLGEVRSTVIGIAITSPLPLPSSFLLSWAETLARENFPSQQES